MGGWVIPDKCNACGGIVWSAERSPQTRFFWVLEGFQKVHGFIKKSNIEEAFSRGCWRDSKGFTQLHTRLTDIEGALRLSEGSRKFSMSSLSRLHVLVQGSLACSVHGFCKIPVWKNPPKHLLLFTCGFT